MSKGFKKKKRYWVVIPYKNNKVKKRTDHLKSEKCEVETEIKKSKLSCENQKSRKIKNLEKSKNK